MSNQLTNTNTNNNNIIPQTNQNQLSPSLQPVNQNQKQITSPNSQQINKPNISSSPGLEDNRAKNNKSPGLFKKKSREGLLSKKNKYQDLKIQELEKYKGELLEKKKHQEERALERSSKKTEQLKKGLALAEKNHFQMCEANLQKFNDQLNITKESSLDKTLTNYKKELLNEQQEQINKANIELMKKQEEREATIKQFEHFHNEGKKEKHSHQVRLEQAVTEYRSFFEEKKKVDQKNLQRNSEEAYNEFTEEQEALYNQQIKQMNEERKEKIQEKKKTQYSNIYKLIQNFEESISESLVHEKKNMQEDLKRVYDQKLSRFRIDLDKEVVIKEEIFLTELEEIQKKKISWEMMEEIIHNDLNSEVAYQTEESRKILITEDGKVEKEKKETMSNMKSGMEEEDGEGIQGDEGNEAKEEVEGMGCKDNELYEKEQDKQSVGIGSKQGNISRKVNFSQGTSMLNKKGSPLDKSEKEDLASKYKSYISSVEGFIKEKLTRLINGLENYKSILMNSFDSIFLNIFKGLEFPTNMDNERVQTNEEKQGDLNTNTNSNPEQEYLEKLNQLFTSFNLLISSSNEEMFFRFRRCELTMKETDSELRIFISKYDKLSAILKVVLHSFQKEFLVSNDEPIKVEDSKSCINNNNTDKIQSMTNSLFFFNKVYKDIVRVLIERDLITFKDKEESSLQVAQSLYSTENKQDSLGLGEKSIIVFGMINNISPSLLLAEYQLYKTSQLEQSRVSFINKFNPVNPNQYIDNLEARNSNEFTSRQLLLDNSLSNKKLSREVDRLKGSRTMGFDERRSHIEGSLDMNNMNKANTINNNYNNIENIHSRNTQSRNPSGTVSQFIRNSTTTQGKDKKDNKDLIHHTVSGNNNNLSSWQFNSVSKNSFLNNIIKVEDPLNNTTSNINSKSNQNIINPQQYRNTSKDQQRQVILSSLKDEYRSSLEYIVKFIEIEAQLIDKEITNTKKEFIRLCSINKEFIHSNIKQYNQASIGSNSYTLQNRNTGINNSSTSKGFFSNNSQMFASLEILDNSIKRNENREKELLKMKSFLSLLEEEVNLFIEGMGGMAGDLEGDLFDKVIETKLNAMTKKVQQYNIDNTLYTGSMASDLEKAMKSLKVNNSSNSNVNTNAEANQEERESQNIVKSGNTLNKNSRNTEDRGGLGNAGKTEGSFGSMVMYGSVNKSMINSNHNNIIDNRNDQSSAVSNPGYVNYYHKNFYGGAGIGSNVSNLVKESSYIGDYDMFKTQMKYSSLMRDKDRLLSSFQGLPPKNYSYKKYY